MFTNQLRQKIGVMFGNPETTPGGLALKFYASVRMDSRKIETLKEYALVIEKDFIEQGKNEDGKHEDGTNNEAD